MTSSPFEPTLRAAWGHEFEGFAHWPIVSAGVPRDPADLLGVLRAAPRDALEYVACRDAPGETMTPAEPPCDLAEVFAPDGGRRFVLRAGNVAAWSAPVAAWCRRFAALVDAAAGASGSRVADVRAEIYVTSPGGITAFHADPSHNFTHQVLGRREIHAFSNADPRLIDEETRAGVYLHRARYPVYRAECEDRASRFALEPGTCCYLPPLAAHWIQNGDELSVSYVLSVRTDREIHEKLVHGMNARLRLVGWNPARFGTHSGRDRVKASLERTLRGTRRWFARHVQRLPRREYLDPCDVLEQRGAAARLPARAGERSGSVADGDGPATIGVIGAGHVGSQVARLALARGYSVVLGNSRGPRSLSALVAELGPGARAATAEEAARAGDLVVIAVPLRSYRALPVEPLAGKIVIDANNYYPERDGRIAELDNGSTTTSELLQAHLPASRVVKALNHVAAAALTSDARPPGSSDRRALALAGDDPGAKATVARLLDELGFDTVDAGPLRESWRIQHGTPGYGPWRSAPQLRADLAAALRASRPRP